MTIPPKRWKRSGAIRPVNTERHEREWSRAYHSLERVLFVKRLPCIACGVRRCHNSHIENGGKSRKADYDKIVPACRTHHDELDNGNGRAAFEAKYDVYLEACAAETERQWLAFSGETS